MCGDHQMNRLNKFTKITCYVLGASVETSSGDPATEGSITASPRAYNTVLKQAHSRTFNLLKKN
jgi:hypothetical protein